MSTPMEVDQRLQRNLSLDILLLFCYRELFGRRVEAVDVGLVVVLVVELHDLARDGGLERTVVICEKLMSLAFQTEKIEQRTWKIRQSGLASDEAHAGHGGSSPGSSSSEGRAGSRSAKEGCRHDCF